MITKNVSYTSLKEQLVVITGGASGIGRSLVEAFYSQGARVAFLDVNEEAGTELLSSLRKNTEQRQSGLQFYPCDLCNVSALQAVMQNIEAEYGHAKVLVNNAGNDDRHLTPEVSQDYFDNCIATNFRHYFFVAQALLPGIIENGGGSIINFGSIAWKIGESDCPIYLSCKAAVHGLTRGLAREFGSQGVRVNTVLPGWVMTQRQKDLWLDEAGIAEIDRAQCLKAQLLPEDLAAMVLFLASDQSKMCTSQEFIVDGGWV